jgi:hypothetical protein
VQVAQDNGARFLLVHPKGAGVAPELRYLADEIVQLETHQLSKMFRDKPARADDIDTAEAVASD